MRAGPLRKDYIVTYEPLGFWGSKLACNLTNLRKLVLVTLGPCI